VPQGKINKHVCLLLTVTTNETYTDWHVRQSFFFFLLPRNGGWNNRSACQLGLFVSLLRWSAIWYDFSVSVYNQNLRSDYTFQDQYSRVRTKSPEGFDVFKSEPCYIKAIKCWDFHIYSFDTQMTIRNVPASGNKFIMVSGLYCTQLHPARRFAIYPCPAGWAYRYFASSAASIKRGFFWNTLRKSNHLAHFRFFKEISAMQIPHHVPPYPMWMFVVVTLTGAGFFRWRIGTAVCRSRR